MKTKLPLALIAVFTIITACEKQSTTFEGPNFNENSEERLMMIAIDNNNQFYFVSQQIDKEANLPAWSSILPMKHKLYRKANIEDEFELINDDFNYVEDIQFDSNNKMLIRTHLGITRLDGNDISNLLEEEINSFAIDSEDVIWAGGYNSGLIKINADGDITRYTNNSSALPTNGITFIHVDNQDVVWVALWDNHGIVRIEEEDWTFFNSTNSNLTMQNIWTINSDSNNNIWIGTGHDNPSLSLMRFNGTVWENMSPEINNKIVQGTIRKIAKLDSKIYVVSNQYNYNAFNQNIILEYDGQNWTKISLFADGKIILDLESDNFRKTLWILTSNNGLCKKTL